MYHNNTNKHQYQSNKHQFAGAVTSEKQSVRLLPESINENVVDLKPINENVFNQEKEIKVQQPIHITDSKQLKTITYKKDEITYASTSGKSQLKFTSKPLRPSFKIPAKIHAAQVLVSNDPMLIADMEPLQSDPC